MTVNSTGICLILLRYRTNSEFVPLVPVLVSPCTRFTHSFPNFVVQNSLVTGYFTKFIVSNRFAFDRVYTWCAEESFQLQMGFSFPFLCAKDLRTSLLIMRSHSFFTLLYVGGTYTREKRGGQCDPPYVITPRRLSEGRGFSKQFFYAGPASL